MTDLNSTLLGRHPFVNHCAFTLWRLEHNPAGADKKPVKVPVHYDGHTRHSLGRPARRGKPAVAPNPAPPMTAEQAIAWLKHHRATGGGHDRKGEVGYIDAGFRPSGTGLVCIDLDDCLRDGKWTAGAEQLMARFPGALIELSVSGRGAHIWVTVSGEGPGRLGKQITPLGEIEVYADGQFIAQGTVLAGDARTDHTAAVQALVSEFWPRRDIPRQRGARTEWDDLDTGEQERVLAEIRSTFPHLRQDTYEDWVAIGMALTSLGDDLGLELWHEVSERWPGYDFDVCEAKWWSLDASRTSYQALFIKAKEANNGWENPRARKPLGEAAEVFEATASGVTPLLALPAGAVLERPANVPDPASTELSFMAAAQGQITASLARVTTALVSPESKLRLRYDTFKEADYISVGGEPWHEITDVDLIDLRFRFEQRGFKPISAECMSDAVRLACASNKVDSAKLWMDAQVWDGVERIDTVFPRFYGTADTPYTRACGAYLFTALAGRTLRPGCQADMVVILVGVQGASKTTSVEVLAPDPANFGEVDLSKKDADVVRAIHGKQVMELAELQGLSGRAMEATKAWVRRREEKWTPKFSNKEATYLRRAVVIGTTNENEFLDDPTGERRWLPITVGLVNSAGLREIRDQLWAEGAARFRKNGIEWQQAEALAKAEHGKHKVHDDWIEPIKTWLDSVPTPVPGHPLTTEKRGSKPLTLADVLMGALRMTADRIDPKSSKRAAKIMRSLNYGPKTIWLEGEDVRRWVPSGYPSGGFPSQPDA